VLGERNVARSEFLPEMGRHVSREFRKECLGEWASYELVVDRRSSNALRIVEESSDANVRAGPERESIRRPQTDRRHELVPESHDPAVARYLNPEKEMWERAVDQEYQRVRLHPLRVRDPQVVAK
jgi:hypothetical protein